MVSRNLLNRIVRLVSLLTILTQRASSARFAQLHERYALSWNVIGTGENAKIEFEAVVATKGYIGLGFSSNGAMTNADIVIVGVKDDGQPYLEDMHGVGNTMPVADAEKNYELISAVENGTHTHVKFSRLLKTCDKEDMPITDAGLRLIWSIGEDDNIAYHDVNRGARSVYLLDPELVVPDLTQLEKYDVMANITMPKQKTTYWCTIHKLPVFEGKHHMIAYDAQLNTPEALKHSHHMNVLKCLHLLNPDEMYGKWVDHPGFDCDHPEPGFPGDNCLFFEYGWALGGEIAVNPENVGFQFNSGQYVKLEVHLDNPDLLENVQVYTGFSVYHTDKPKDIEGTTLMIAAPVNYMYMVPPNTTDFVTTVHCMPMCTSKLPDTGVKVYNAFLHAHTSARKMKVRHFRQGKELPWIVNDESYDFNYQTNRVLREEVLLLPGDQLISECTYDTTWKNGLSVIGGHSTSDEMCMVFLAYYPAVDQWNMIGCQDAMQQNNLFNFLGINRVALTGSDPEVQAPPNLAGKRFSQVVEEFPWTDELKAEYEWLQRYGPHGGICLPLGPVPMVGFYPHVPEYSEPDQCLTDSTTQTTTTAGATNAPTTTARISTTPSAATHPTPIQNAIFHMVVGVILFLYY